MSQFRDSLSTDLAKHVYDWSDIRKAECSPEILKDITLAFCIREGFECLEITTWGSEWASVRLAGAESLSAYSAWRMSFLEHGYPVPILVIEDGHCDKIEDLS